MSADNLLSWVSDDGSKRCLLIVIDEEKHHKEVGYKTLELCELNNDDQWETKKTIDSINELESFGIPPGLAP